MMMFGPGNTAAWTASSSPFRLEASSSIQNYTIQVKNVEHNVSVDEKLFVKPSQ